MKTIKGEYFEQLANGDNIFYCHTHNAYDFLRNPPKNDFVLITHNSDGKITDNPKRFDSGSSNDLDIRAVTIPDNLIKWFAQNVEVVHPKIESIPIGLENSMWFPEIRKEEKILSKRNEPKNFKKLMYMNHNINTNPAERMAPWRYFKDKPWVTAFQGGNGYNFDDYLENICSHKFVLCPEGNGTDTHRTWEVLYAGGIPIEKRNLNNKFYEDLPICFVDRWEDVSEDFLNEKFDEIKSKEWNLEKLWFTYWTTRIHNVIKV